MGKEGKRGAGDARIVELFIRKLNSGSSNEYITIKVEDIKL